MSANASNRKRMRSLIASCIVAFFLGSSYTWSVFTTPLADRLNAILHLTGSSAMTAADLSIVFSTYSMVSIVAMIFGGALNDRFGPRWLVFAGGIMMGGGYILCGMTSSVMVLILSFGVLACLGIATSYSCALNNTVKLFPEKKGLVSGIITACYGLGPVILAPILNSCIAGIGVSRTFIYLGIISAVILMGLSMFIIRVPAAPPTVPATAAGTAAASRDPHDKKWTEMVRDPIFYVMLLILASGAFFGVMLTSEISPISLSRMEFTAARAAFMASLVSIGSVCGRLISGAISDKLGRINTLTILLVIAALTLGLLVTTNAGTPLRFEIAITVLGFCYGSLMSVFPGFCADQFGTTNNSLNYGVLWVGFSASGALAPSLASRIVKTTQSYDGAFYVAIGFAVFGILMTFLYRVLSRRSNAAETAEEPAAAEAAQQ